MEKFFCIIGAQRSGTTSLANLLAAHPEVRMASPSFPEPKFFITEEEVAKGKEYYLNKYFSKEVREKKLFGEKSTSYIEIPEAGKSIKSFFPEAKILVMLRNPVERALSNYYYSKKNSVEVRSLRETFLENKPAGSIAGDFSVSPFNYLGRGEYLKYLKPYIEIFGMRSVGILILEELLADQSKWTKVFDFLEIERIKENFTFDISNAAERAEQSDPEVNEHLKDYYRKHIEELEDYFQRDLSIWKR